MDLRSADSPRVFYEDYRYQLKKEFRIGDFGLSSLAPQCDASCEPLGGGQAILDRSGRGTFRVHLIHARTDVPLGSECNQQDE
jgi:hypothetical protein